jgi:hypothetical protein
MADTDRLLLEAAARAAGLGLTWGETYKVGDDEIDCTDIPYAQGASPDESPFHWNPLTDDGDALRLAVKLRMVVSLAYCTCCAVVDWADNEDENEVMVRFGEDFPDREATDALAATRRAIVRAAAAIGGHHG